MIEVHPLADLFPMMADDELAELAEDIRENGLIHPIVLDADGRLVDGRNRLRACEIAEVEPQFELLNGHDAAAFIVSANLARRNLTKGQQAIALAMIYPDSEKGGRGRKSEAGKVLVSGGFSRQRLDQARAVLRYSEGLAKDVLANRTSLDAALDQVHANLRAAVSIDEQMAELRARAPDIADLVADERITLHAGIAELRERERLDQEAVDAGVRAVKRLNDIPVQAVMIEKALTISRDVLANLDIETVVASMQRLAELKRGQE